MKDNLTNPSLLCTKYKVGKERMEQMLATLEPVLTMPFGRGTMRLYDADKAHARVETALAEDAAARNGKAAAPAPAAQVDLSPITDGIAALRAEVANMHASINGLRTEIAAMRKEMDSVNEMALDKLLVEPAGEFPS
jgi:cell division protein FtsB